MSDGVFRTDDEGRQGCSLHRDSNTYAAGGVTVMSLVLHRHRWLYDGTDGPYYVYHCDDHDPPVVRRTPRPTCGRRQEGDDVDEPPGP